MSYRLCHLRNKRKCIALKKFSFHKLKYVKTAEMQVTLVRFELLKFEIYVSYSFHNSNNSNIFASIIENAQCKSFSFFFIKQLFYTLFSIKTLIYVVRFLLTNSGIRKSRLVSTINISRVTSMSRVWYAGCYKPELKLKQFIRNRKEV